MLKSLMLNDTAKYFPQAFGECYHYAPNTAALLYEVVVLNHRGARTPGHSLAKSDLLMSRELSGSDSVAAICHEAAGVVNAAKYVANEHGQYEWQLWEEVPWPGMLTSAAMTFVRYLPCPLRAYTESMPITTRIADLDLRDFVFFANEWVLNHRYYFPALRQVELAAQGLEEAIRTSIRGYEWLTKDSLPSFACYAFFKEVGYVRTLRPDVFDKDGNSRPSRSNVKPLSVVMRGGKHEKRVHMPRAAIVWELFCYQSASSWDGYRADGNPSNDRIENLVSLGFKCKHPDPYSESVTYYDYVFDYKYQLPTSLYFSRFWRYGIERLAWDIDQKAL